MSEIKIARFVDVKACESIFSENSTFVLRSPYHYRPRCEDTPRCDGQEGMVEHTDGGSSQMECFVLSCWTMLDGDEPTPDEWGIFKDSVVAIVSTPSKVCAFLKKAFEIEDGKLPCRRRFPFMYVKDEEVRYADAVPKTTHANIEDEVVFTKRERFSEEKEYRFALAYDMGAHPIDSYIFVARDPGEYVDKLFVKPTIGQAEKKELQRIIGDASGGYGYFCGKGLYGVIANSDILYPTQQ